MTKAQARLALQEARQSLNYLEESLDKNDEELRNYILYDDEALAILAGAFYAVREYLENR